MSSRSPAKRNKIVLRSVADLSLHPATSLIPPAPTPSATEMASADLTPLETLPDGQVLTGREQFNAARSVRRRRVATLVVNVPDDQVEIYILRKALECQYLTDDQRACIAVEYAARLSAKMRKERAAKAAAIRHGHSACRTTGSNKKDSRAEACARFRIPPKKFRQVRRLAVAHPTSYRDVFLGVITLKQARDRVAQHQLREHEADRSAAAPTLSVPGLILGDARLLIPTLPDDHFTAIITDPPYGVAFRQEWRGGAEVAIAGDSNVAEAIALFRDVLTAAGPKMRRQAFLVTFVPAKHEPEFRKVVTDLGWTIIAYPIWAKNSRMMYPHLNVASQHERMLLAVRGDAKLRTPLSDVFRHGKTHASSHPCEKPVILLKTFINATTVAGEAVLDPFAGSGSTIIAAKRLGRIATGTEVERRWYLEAAKRIGELH